MTKPLFYAEKKFERISQQKLTRLDKKIPHPRNTHFPRLHVILDKNFLAKLCTKLQFFEVCKKVTVAVH